MIGKRRISFIRRIEGWNIDKKMRWFIMFLICVLSVFIFIATTCSYFIFMVRQSKTMAEEQLSLLATNYETTLESYKSMGIALTLDETIQEYVKTEEITSEEYFRNATNAQNTLMNVTNMVSNMNFIAVVSYQSQEYLYKGNITQLYTGFSGLYRQDYESSSYGAKTGSLRMSYNDTYLIDGKRTLNVYLPIYSLTYINREIGLLCMNFNDNFLEGFSQDYLDDQSELMIVDEQGNILSGMAGSGEGKGFVWRELVTGKQGNFTRESMLYNYQKVGRWNYYLVNRVPLVGFYLNGLKMLPVLFAIVLLVTLMSLYTGSRIIRRLYHPLEVIVQEMNKVAGGRLDVRIQSDNTGEDFKKLANGFNYMMDEIDILMHKVQEEQRQKERIHFNALQSQIQPHFLYNTLECIHWQAAAEESREISTMVKALAQYYRICLSRGRDIITLEEELEHIRNYLIIQNMRYGNIIEYEPNVAGRYLAVDIPKLTLQPLIENSIYHGIKCKDVSKGKIEISAQVRAGGLVISVSDNGRGMAEEEIGQLNASLSRFQDGEGYGVRNVNKRIELLFGPKYGLEYMGNKSGGITVEIHLPMK